MAKDEVLLEVSNSQRTGSIYTVILDVLFDERYIILRNNQPLGENRVLDIALAEACERVLKGFKQPGHYTALIDGIPYVNKEVNATPEPEFVFS